MTCHKRLRVACVLLALAAPAAAQVRAFVGARIFDGTADPVIENGTLVIRNGKITAVGPSDKVKPPRGALVVNVRGKTITPGLINAHGHVSDVEGQGRR